jgi:hypothetical protein
MDNRENFRGVLDAPLIVTTPASRHFHYISTSSVVVITKDPILQYCYN